MEYPTASNPRHSVLKRLQNNSFARIVVIAIIIGLTSAGFSIYHHTKQFTFTAPTDGFSIVFPHTPKIETIPATTDSQGQVEHGRLYDYVDTSLNRDYIVYVIHNSSETDKNPPIAATQTALLNDIGQLAAVGKSNVSNARLTTFESLPAATATLTPSDDQAVKTQLLTVFHAHTIYMMLGTGLSSAEFKNFTDSFHILPS